MILYLTLLVIVSLEVFIYLLVKIYKKNFQWILTDEDEYPVFNKKKFKLFKENSFDKNLGWIQKLNSSGFGNNLNFFLILIVSFFETFKKGSKGFKLIPFIFKNS